MADRIVPRGVTYIRILDWVMLIILFLGMIGVLVPTLVTPPYPISPERITGGIIGTSITGAYFILTIIALIAAYRGGMWAKIYHAFFSILSLFIFPLGTIIQGIALYFLFADKETSRFFSNEKVR